MKTTIQIPSPIPYLMEVPDLRAHNTTYDWRLLFMLVLMGLGSGHTNLLAIAQWVQDQRDWLLSLGLGRRASGRALPAQATLYRFVWALEQYAAAATLARLSRGHWAIENRLHHKRDVALGEDACGSGCPAQPAPGLPSSKGRPCVAQPPSLRRQSYAPVSVVIGVRVYMIRA
ncbi:transposase family protein [Meiothermus sp. CFH 77666]|uniref:transposase family protein n=1 Tax=Meiothermus sp. CFH 77666 TaxID=2817942 RepID=UPI001AA0827E|nr:transposase family protein [Meiothermus sp. CFH 77666]MBO1438560.1 transposase family protein [Meiothermus sp. CFH 77666]